MRTLKIEIKRSELMSATIFVPRWELPILYLVHGKANVAVKGEVDNDRPWPTRASEEYSRLEQVYGHDKDSGASEMFVALAYGKDLGGVQALGNRIRELIKDARVRPPKAPPPEIVEDEEFANPDDIIDPNGDGPTTDADVIDAGDSPTPEAGKGAEDALTS